MDGGKARGGSANIRFLVIHSLMERNVFLVPEAVNWAGEIPRGGGEAGGQVPASPADRLTQNAAWNGKPQALNPGRPEWEVMPGLVLVSASC